MDNALIEFGSFALISLFTMVNPVSVTPVYTGMTAGLDPKLTRKVAVKASITAFLILIAFAIVGDSMMGFFGISTNGLRIVGGVIFFMTGYEMLQARLAKTKGSHPEQIEFAEDIAITPLAIPLICGPGAITTAILLMNDATTLAHQGIVLGSIFVVMVVTLFSLIFGSVVLGFLGKDGNKVLLRIMGLIVMVIAVEFFMAGVTPYVKAMIAG